MASLLFSMSASHPELREWPIHWHRRLLAELSKFRYTLSSGKYRQNVHVINIHKGFWDILVVNWCLYIFCCWITSFILYNALKINEDTYAHKSRDSQANLQEKLYYEVMLSWLSLNVGILFWHCFLLQCQFVPTSSTSTETLIFKSFSRQKEQGAFLWSAIATS